MDRVLANRLNPVETRVSGLREGVLRDTLEPAWDVGEQENTGDGKSKIVKRIGPQAFLGVG